MSFIGVCQICESAEGRHSCDRCGSLACEVHYDEDLGVCTQCASAIRRSDRKSTDE
ncbi:MAG: hypothetical protein ACOCR0_01475 [Haloferacaceae archaeon]